MPSFSKSLESALHRALEAANERSHEYATLEHLLLALLDDRDAAAVMRACTVDLETLRSRVTDYLDNDLGALVSKEATEAQPTTGFQRVIHRAVVHVQSSGREEVTGANVLVAIFAERESHAAYFLQEQEMTRFDAVQYISHGIAKRPGMSEPRHVRGVDEDQTVRRRGAQAGPGRAQHLLRQPQQEGARRQDRSADRPRARGAAHHPGALPPPEEQPAVRRRSRRRQDGDRRGPGPQDHQGRGARGPAGRHHLRARHGRAAGRHALSRRLRGAAQGGDEGDRELSGLDPVHRRDPHRDRRRRHLGRRHGRLQPSEAGAAVGHACAASARRPTRSTASTSRRTARSCAASRRST